MALMNSQLFWWYLTKTGTILTNNYFRFKPDYIKPFPVPIIDVETANKLEKLVDEILNTQQNSSKDIFQYEKQINDIIFSIYGLSQEEVYIIQNDVNTK